jgi:hypothetical protein
MRWATINAGRRLDRSEVIDVGLATLALQGVRYAGVEGFSRTGAILAVAVNLSLGLVIVALDAGLAQ